MGLNLFVILVSRPLVFLEYLEFCVSLLDKPW